MSYSLSYINFKTVSDPKAFLAECDARYQARVAEAAEKIIANKSSSPIVLLSGPSGSGKTTTAMKIAEALAEMGIRSQSLSMDNYYKTYNPRTSPKTPDGKDDLESPACPDLDLLGEHLLDLAAGREIHQPIYNFATRIQAGPIGKAMRLGEHEVVVCEGIHALNDEIARHCPEAFRLYISARSNVVDEDGKVIFKGTWMRLMRRTVRDYLFRGTEARFIYFKI